MRDHLDNRAFIADVLLYDLLVIPTMPKSEDEAEWPASWGLAKQKALLGDLGDLAIPIPWDKGRRETWQKRFDDAQRMEHGLARGEVTAIVAADVAIARDPQYEDLPYKITRQLLQDFASADADDRLFRQLRVTREIRPGSILEAVSANQRSDSFAADVHWRGRHETYRRYTASLQPSSDGNFSFQKVAILERARIARLPEKAMKLAKKTDFIEMRQDFYGWWSDVIAGTISVAEARADMERRISGYHELIKRNSLVVESLAPRSKSAT